METGCRATGIRTRFGGWRTCSPGSSLFDFPVRGWHSPLACPVETRTSRCSPGRSTRSGSRTERMRLTILRLLSSFRSSRAERELAREIRSHLQLLEDQYIARGMDAEEARCAALRAFGGVEQVKAHQREARMVRSLGGWPMDLRLGGRLLVKYPGLTIVGGVAMAFAIWV